jgi:hypothetical protein
VSEKLYAFSIVTGQVFDIEQEDIETLYTYQVPLKQKPKANCKKCYGRGYVDRTSQTKMYNMCPCLSTRIADGYTPSKLSIEMPRYY